MKKIGCFLLFFSMALAAQEKIGVIKSDSLQLHTDIFLGYDLFGSAYFIADNVFIKKYKDRNIQYKNQSLGKIAKTDLDNSLQMLLFYEAFNTAVILDDQLNETQQINFSKLTDPIVASAVGIASGNRLWVYNTLTQKVGLYNYIKNDYLEITTPFQGNIKYYTSDFNYFEWVDDASNWYRCDIYGKVKILGKTPESESLQLVPEMGLIYKKEGRLYFFDATKNKSTAIDVDKKTFDGFLYKDKILSIFTEQRITNYKIILP